MNVSEVDAEEGADLEIKLDRVIRQEGDAVFVGQVNDPRQAQLLFDYSEKLCFIGEMNSKTPAEAVKQLIDWVGVDKVLANLKGVICQKLIRRLCDDCKQAFRPDPRLLKQLGLPPETTVLYRAPKPPDPEDEAAPTVEELCADCNGMPYHGRAAVYELFEMTDPMREVIAEGGNVIAIRKQMAAEKQRMLQQDALRLVLNGTTSLEELRRAFSRPGGGGKGKPRGTGKGRPGGGGQRRPVKKRPRPQ
jgi:type II secretory ATPase GspE/PulE/Tfp pilus assembly ATPase PilB-like protein